MSPDDLEALLLDIEILGFQNARVFRTADGWQASVRTPEDAWIVGVAATFCGAIESVYRQVMRRAETR